MEKTKVDHSTAKEIEYWVKELNLQGIYRRVQSMSEHPAYLSEERGKTFAGDPVSRSFRKAKNYFFIILYKLKKTLR